MGKEQCLAELDSETCELLYEYVRIVYLLGKGGIDVKEGEWQNWTRDCVAELYSTIGEKSEQRSEIIDKEGVDLEAFYWEVWQDFEYRQEIEQTTAKEWTERSEYEDGLFKMIILLGMTIETIQDTLKLFGWQFVSIPWEGIEE